MDEKLSVISAVPLILMIMIDPARRRYHSRIQIVLHTLCYFVLPLPIGRKLVGHDVLCDWRGAASLDTKNNGDNKL